MQSAIEVAVIALAVMAVLFSYAGGLSPLGGVLAVFGSARLAGFFILTLLLPQLWQLVKEPYQLLWVFGVIAMLS